MSEARTELRQLTGSPSLEAMYDKVIAACLRCDPVPACKREDDQLEPPWEVIDRILRERNEAREYADLMRDMIDTFAECEDTSFPWEKLT